MQQFESFIVCVITSLGLSEKVSLKGMLIVRCYTFKSFLLNKFISNVKSFRCQYLEDCSDDTDCGSDMNRGRCILPDNTALPRLDLYTSR